MTFAEWLEVKRLELGLCDKEFAERLGISPPGWCLVKYGGRRAGIKTMLGALTLFPEARDMVIALVLREHR